MGFLFSNIHPWICEYTNVMFSCAVRIMPSKVKNARHGWNGIFRESELLQDVIEPCELLIIVPCWSFWWAESEEGLCEANNLFIPGRVVISRQLGDTVRSQRDYDSHENTSFHRAVIQGWGGCSWLLSFLLFFVCFTFVVVVLFF